MHLSRLVVAALACSFSTCMAAPAEPARVAASDGQLVYEGEITEQANKALFALYGNLDPKPAVLAIRSEGGEINAGMDLGEWLHARQLDVKVTGYCLSSCANYVFPAARNKTVGNTAVIGFHGGASEALARVEAATNNLLAGTPKKRRAAMKAVLAPMVQRLGVSRDREAAFFSALGVRQDIASLGQRPGVEERIVKSGAAGWTYSLEDFARLGVANITVLMPPWLPARLDAGKLEFPVIAIE